MIFRSVVMETKEQTLIYELEILPTLNVAGGNFMLDWKPFEGLLIKC